MLRGVRGRIGPISTVRSAAIRLSIHRIIEEWPGCVLVVDKPGFRPPEAYPGKITEEAHPARVQCSAQRILPGTIRRHQVFGVIILMDGTRVPDKILFPCDRTTMTGGAYVQVEMRKIPLKSCLRDKQIVCPGIKTTKWSAHKNNPRRRDPPAHAVHSWRNRP